MQDGDNWKYGDPPELSEIRGHIAARSTLLMMLPCCPLPVEGFVSRTSPNGDFVQVGGEKFWESWVPRADMRIVDILRSNNTKQRQLNEINTGQCARTD